jgi:microcystin-dependent protein
VTAALSAVYPVGSIYVNAAVSTNPNTLLGFGTWEAFGAGRVMVGFNSSDALFDTLEETGGSKDAVVVSHTHTATSTDSGHTHSVVQEGGRNTSSAYQNGPNATFRGEASATLTTATGTANITTTVASTGSSGTNANVQPYITVRMWKRTA